MIPQGIIESTLKNKGLSAAFIEGIFALSGITLFIKKSVKELMDGYQDPLLKYAKMFLPDMVTDDEFGFLKKVFFLSIYRFI